MLISLLRHLYSRKLTIHDETRTGSILNRFKIRLFKQEITVKELIRERVFQEVAQYNSHQPVCYRGLIPPDEAEYVLNGYKLRRNHKLDPEQYFFRAMDSFMKKGFWIMVNDQRLEDPEYSIRLNDETRVSFIRLIPVGQ